MHEPAPDASVIVQSVADPASTVTVPPGVPPYCGETVTDTRSACSFPYVTPAADSDTFVVVAACDTATDAGAEVDPAKSPPPL